MTPTTKVGTYKLRAILTSSRGTTQTINFEVQVLERFCTEGFTNIPTLTGPYSYTLNDVKLDILLSGLSNSQCSYNLDLTMLSGTALDTTLFGIT